MRPADREDLTPFTAETPRRDALRTMGVAGAALLGAGELSKVAAAKKRQQKAQAEKKRKKGKQGPQGPQGPQGAAGSGVGATGPQGPAGPQGATLYGLVTFPVEDTPRAITTTVGQATPSSATCPGGSVLTGGGYQLDSPSVNTENLATVQVVLTTSISSPNTWTVSVQRIAASTGTEDLTIRANAICTSLSAA